MSATQPAVGWARRLLPKGLYTRSLLIIVAPMVLLQGVLAFVFMERHYEVVTERLSNAVAQNVAALAALHAASPSPESDATLIRVARERLSLQVEFTADRALPPPRPRPFFSILDEALSKQLKEELKRPFWIDTVGRSNFVEIRVLLDDGVMKAIARRSQTYASNSHIFLVWMVCASLVLIGVAILFLRNQIKPIVELSGAAESFGKGRAAPELRIRGAREVREASRAFVDMRDRIERQIEQRTAMLAGVSHDLRTMLTRFRLQLAVLDECPEIEDLNRDVDEMTRMLEAYLAFVRGDAGEPPQPTDVPAMLDDLKRAAETSGAKVSVESHGDPVAVVRPDAFRRCLGNLVSNAARYARRIQVTAIHDGRTLEIRIDDDGPGVPLEKREEVFRPFLRLDAARNQDHGGSGLGLAITRDIARSHGGDVTLEQSPLGGLRAVVRVPA
ncbi:ATP-binding protein [Methylopila musalis]|uniref:histidine kinase n=1 Tax=Methylopila musalis TaxID=1134781 RepID=A0ABW3Z941_9HYPH